MLAAFLLAAAAVAAPAEPLELVFIDSAGCRFVRVVERPVVKKKAAIRPAARKPAPAASAASAPVVKPRPRRTATPVFSRLTGKALVEDWIPLDCDEGPGPTITERIVVVPPVPPAAPPADEEGPAPTERPQTPPAPEEAPPCDCFSPGPIPVGGFPVGGPVVLPPVVVPAAPIPEPSTVLLMLAGFLGLVLHLKNNRKR